MRFCDLLKTAVFSSAVVATLLAATATVASVADDSSWLVLAAVGWWSLSVVIGMLLGRRTDANPPIAQLLAAAESKPNLPLTHPIAAAINRLWPLAVLAVATGIMGIWAPQVPAITAGFAIIWSLSWRHQANAVLAIELRDGTSFYVKQTSPVKPIELVRVPGKPGELHLIQPSLETKQV